MPVTLILSDGARLADGMKLVYATFKVPYLRRISSRYRSLNSADLEDIWSETTFQIFTGAKTGRFDGEIEALSGLIWKITFCRATDIIRRRLKFPGYASNIDLDTTFAIEVDNLDSSEVL